MRCPLNSVYNQHVGEACVRWSNMVCLSQYTGTIYANGKTSNSIAVATVATAVDLQNIKPF